MNYELWKKFIIYFFLKVKKKEANDSLYIHLKNPFIAIVSYSFDHIDSKGIHQLIMGLSQNLTCCFSQTKDEIIARKKMTIFKMCE